MSRLLAAVLAPVVVLVVLLAHCPAASAATVITRLSCQGAILGFAKLGDQRLAVYQDGQGHRIELWCTRRILDSQFDLRIVLQAPARERDGRQEPAQPGRLATVGGCFFDNGDNEGPIIVHDSRGGFASVEWVTMDPAHRRKYRFNYDFATGLVAITATVSGCAPVLKVVAPPSGYHQLARLLPHPETQACALGTMPGFNPAAPNP